MRTVNRLSVLVLLVSIIALVAWLLPARQTISAKADPAGAIEQRQQGHIDQATDPCRFMKLYDRPFNEIEERFNWEMYGYPAELPLSEAIGLFNREKQCSPLYAEYVLLTEEELIAAIVAGPDAGKQGAIWLAQKDALWEIASQKMMPKGARLVASTGGRVVESPLRPHGTITAKGITITLLLGLDKHNGHGNVAKPEQTIIVRKIYSKVETVR